ncbi:DUF11 domain-containing protein [Myxacorys almedinensis]|uniref:DUF11 domain-containing protein n=1 Tax=Myxacorys almedinensis A TaxID=2690445 RepID=A0A8J7Z317_9CYAN|nr:DUF11 domain-containing protein [Myxacorys almedinensis]NDJ16916.1 DUF11 domain-containing protein [Myxacorys almedinensis A]
MKKYWLVGASAAIALSALPINGSPAIAQIFNTGSAIAQTVLQQPNVILNLVADQQTVKTDPQGKTVVAWQPVDGKVQAKPGDIFRFTVTSKNEGKREAKNVAITQPVPQGTVYQLNSATISQGIAATYSIDQGKTFVARPVVKVTLPNGTIEERPAPAEAYTNVRWTLSQSLKPDASAIAAYQVKVR